MPEGPSIIILKEAIQKFKGKKILQAEGNAKLDIERMSGQKIIDFKTWGKHFLICFKDFSLRIHLMMFGTYRVNEEREAKPRFKLTFVNECINFYACSLKYIEGELDDTYDWTADVMNDDFNPKAARAKIKKLPEGLICDVLLNQKIFAGVGNIIKNEVLFRTRLHPETLVKDIPPRKLTEVINDARDYSFEFLKWKKAFVLKKHWQAYTKKKCPRDSAPIFKKYCGKTKRRTFFCEVCQVLYPVAKNKVRKNPQ
ncbi:MAG: DNA-formamidopyrimidine glycosylase family protein [Ginsengibacter sp.]